MTVGMSCRGGWKTEFWRDIKNKGPGMDAYWMLYIEIATNYIKRGTGDNKVIRLACQSLEKMRGRDFHMGCSYETLKFRILRKDFDETVV